MSQRANLYNLVRIHEEWVLPVSLIGVSQLFTQLLLLIFAHGGKLLAVLLVQAIISVPQKEADKDPVRHVSICGQW